MTDYIDQKVLKILIKEAKKLARQYKEITGKPLGITGEIGEFVAADLLNLNLMDARNPGFDALDQEGRRIQIKSRVVTSSSSQRVGRINMKYKFDTVMLVLMDEEFELLDIYEAKRDDVVRELQFLRSKSRNQQGSLKVQKFISISSHIWHREIRNNNNPSLPLSSLEQVTNALMDFGKSIETEDLLPTVIPEASYIVANDPYAFAISVCLDRGTKAEIIWTIPYDINNELGHLDPYRINKMSLGELENLFAVLPRRPRYVNDAPRTLQELTRIVVEECAGDASRIWKGKQASEVKKIFESIHGVGQGIASMGLLLIEKAFSIRFYDRENMDIKPDVHTTRVLYRLGVSTEPTVEAALEASRRMNPEFPGKVDGALWEIGRKWCRPTDPECPACPVMSVCARRINTQPMKQPIISNQIKEPKLAEKHKKTIVLISCVSQKRSTRSKAKDLYISSLFTKSLAYAHRLHPDKIYVLSALYGLVDLEKEIDPYNLTLNTMSANEIRTWSDLVMKQLRQVADVHQDHFIFLAGNNYRKYLLPHLISYEIPFEGLRIGEQLHALSKNSSTFIKNP